jgi:uncharacterized protein YjbI with pentapeptide repeats
MHPFLLISISSGPVSLYQTNTERQSVISAKYHPLISGRTFYGADQAVNGNDSIEFHRSTLKDANLSNTHCVDNNLIGSDLTGANLAGTTWENTWRPDYTNSDNNGNTCIGHMTPFTDFD